MVAARYPEPEVIPPLGGDGVFYPRAVATLAEGIYAALVAAGQRIEDAAAVRRPAGVPEGFLDGSERFGGVLVEAVYAGARFA
jgi:hypothetical protein